MAWLVDPKLPAARQRDLGQQSPALLVNLAAGIRVLAPTFGFRLEPCWCSLPTVVVEELVQVEPAARGGPPVPLLA